MTNNQHGALPGKNKLAAAKPRPAVKKAASSRKALRGGMLRMTAISVCAQLVLVGLALVVYAFFHHVLPRDLQNENVVIGRPTALATSVAVTETGMPALTDNASPASAETPAPRDTSQANVIPEVRVGTAPENYTPDMEERVGSFAVKYADKFTLGEVASWTEDGVRRYMSPNLNISVSVHRVDEATSSGTHTSTVYVTDFYIRDITCLRSALANDRFGQGQYEWVSSMAERSGAIVAINGDFAGMRKNGVVIRDGLLYRKEHSTFDACAINWDGTMVTYASKEWKTDMLVKNNAYQAWSFGPELLDSNGQPLKSFNATNAVKKSNPRTAIGYFEPGHYCFVTVDGRSSESRGLTFSGLAAFMSELGCVQAYNLDGGESTSLWWQGDIINVPSDGGRKVSDAVCLIDGVLQ